MAIRALNAPRPDRTPRKPRGAPKPAREPSARTGGSLLKNKGAATPLLRARAPVMAPAAERRERVVETSDFKARRKALANKRRIKARAGAVKKKTAAREKTRGVISPFAERRGGAKRRDGRAWRRRRRGPWRARPPCSSHFSKRFFQARLSPAKRAYPRWAPPGPEAGGAYRAAPGDAPQEARARSRARRVRSPGR